MASGWFRAWLWTALPACSLLAPSTEDVIGSPQQSGDGGAASGEAGAGHALGGEAGMGGGQTVPPKPGGRAGEAGGGEAGQSDSPQAGAPAGTGGGQCAGVVEPCEPSDTDVDFTPCGPCGTGQAQITRSCRADCTWGEWSAPGACTGVTAECEPDHWYCCAPGAWMWCRASTCEWSGDCDAASCAASSYCDC